MAMAASDKRIDEHWSSFAELAEDYRRKRIVIGVDRAFARRWLLLGGRRSPTFGRLVGISVGVLAAISLGYAAYALYAGSYVAAILLLIVVFLSWKLILQLAVAHARSAAISDEELLRSWFHERRLSILIKESGEIVWNDVDT